MGYLNVDSVAWGEVFKSSGLEGEYPCMDTAYRELKMVFSIDIEFDNFADMLTFEDETIPTYFADRTMDIEYNGFEVDDAVLISFKRSEVLTPGSPCVVNYEVTFSKENA